jgi:hypothetical protein
MLSRLGLAATAGTRLVRDSQMTIHNINHSEDDSDIILPSHHHRDAGSNISLTKIPHCCLRRIIEYSGG